MQQGTTILLVEDDGILVAHLQDTLADLGYRVLPPEARGDRAVEAAIAQRPDLVLMDIELLGPIDGIEAARRIHEVCDLPIVYITGFSQDPFFNQAKSTAPYAYLVKPVPPRELALTVEMTLYRHRLDRELKKREEEFRTLVENVPGAVYRIDCGNPPKLLFVSEGVEAITGYPAADFLAGRAGWAAIAPEEDRDTARRAMTEALRTKAQCEVEYRVRHANGELRWVRDSGRYVCDSAGKPIHFDGVVIDVTGRHRAESSLTESLSELAAIHASVPVALVLVDENRRVRKINQAAAELAGGVQAAGPLAGNVLRCAHALEDPRGCGHSPACEECPVRLAVAASFADQRPRPPFEVWLPPEGDTLDSRRDRAESLHQYEPRIAPRSAACLLVSTAFVSYGGQGRVLICAQDITARKGAERELHASQERYQSLIRTSLDAFWVLDANGMLLEVNEAACALTGYNREELLSMNVSELAAGAAPDRLQPLLELTRVEGRKRFHAQFRHRNRQILEFETSAVYIPSQNVFLCLNRDVTARLRAEQALRESEERFRTFFGNPGVGCAICSPEGRWLEVNDTLCAILGYSREELTGLTWQELTPATELEAELEACRALLEREDAQTWGAYEKRYIRKDGGLVDIALSAQGIRDSQGRVKYVTSVLRDITGRKQAQAAFEGSQRELSSLFAHMAQAVIYQDEDGRILAANPAARRMLGWGPGQDCDFDPAVFRKAHREDGSEFPPDEHPAAVALRTGRAVEGIIMGLPGADGECRWISAAAVPEFRPGDNRPYRVSSTFLDITGRKRAEEQLLQAQKMECVGRLAGGIAHDFNNLLTVINGYSDLLIADLDPADPVRSSVEEIKKAGEQAAGLTRQLLSFSRKQIVQSRILDIDRLLREMTQMLGRLVGEDVQVRMNLDAGPAAVRADQGQLEQVIMNLVANARDAMPFGGELTIETRFAPPEAESGQLAQAPHGWLEIDVCDTGIGMNEATRSRLFEPYFTTKDPGKGTGLGLATVHGIVTGIGGQIEVKTETGRGSLFRIRLPRAEGFAAAAESGTQFPEGLTGTETILVVEDQPEVRTYVANTLKGFGYRVLRAENAGEALLIFEREKDQIDLLLTDIVMPTVNGLELLERLRAIQPELKALLMSGYAEEHPVPGPDGRRPDSLISKPFRPDELGEAVRKALGPTSPAGRVLVVDDEGAVRSFLALVLTRAGYEVMEAPNGRTALEDVRAGGVDLVITDLVMPDKEGIETIRTLRRDGPPVRIIAISGAMGGRFLKVAQLMGADAILAKPISPEALLATVRQVMETPV